MSFTIITDTSANLPSKLLKERDIHVIPYYYSIGDKEFSCLDTDGFDGGKFYKAMRMGAEIKTSAINFQAYVDFFTPFLESGSDILFVSMSSGISSSYRCSEIAAKELREKFPDRKLCLLDTIGASLGEGVGNMLQVKPILKGNENGEIVNFSKVIGRKKAVDALAQRYNMLVKDPESQIVGIAHADCNEDADYLIELLNKKKPPKEILKVMYEPVTGSHVGPGTLALFFMGDSSVRFR